jgi:hypothetical protein
MEPEEITGPIIIIPFGSDQLALTPDEIKAGKERARAIMALDDPKTGEKGNGHYFPEVVDAEGAERATGVPSSWFLERARRREIPFLQFGKYVRFRLKDVLDHVEKTWRAKTRAGK